MTVLFYGSKLFIYNHHSIFFVKAFRLARERLFRPGFGFWLLRPKMETSVRTPRLLRMGSDFSGMDTATVALKRLGCPVELVFCSDNDPHCKKILLASHKPRKFYDDADARTKEEEVSVDVYVGTPPCQPWSSQGKRRGLLDPRGKLLKVPLRYAKRQKPRLFLLENVKGLCDKRNLPVLRGIKKTLVDLGYKVFLGVLNSQDFKVPQQRQRLFVVAIRKDSYRRAFKWPKKLGKRTLSEVLDPLQSSDQPGRLPKAKRAKVLALRAFKKVYKNGTDPRKVPVAIDTGCSMKYATFGVNVSRTLCQARAKTGGFWISNRGRVMSTTEMMKVSGLNDGEMDGWQNHVTPAQFQGMLGNCVPVPLVGSVLQNALYAAGLIASLKDFPV